MLPGAQESDWLTDAHVIAVLLDDPAREASDTEVVVTEVVVTEVVVNEPT